MRDAKWWGCVMALALGACSQRALQAGGATGGASGPPVDAAAGAPPRDLAMATSFPSCAGLPARCGATGSDDCCHALPVPGGTFDRGFDRAGDGFSGTMAHPARLGAFVLDKYEVTVGRFRVFVDAGLGTRAHPPAPGSGAHPAIAGSGWDATWNDKLPPDTAALRAALGCDPDLQTWTDTPGAHEEQPMSCVSWYDALAFCIWDGGYLATEAEWNFAAAGGDEQRAYPWSSPPNALLLDTTHASYWDYVDCFGDGQPGCTVNDLVVVGSKPEGDGRWGHSDLSGNVLEWTLDRQSQYPDPCVDCAQLGTGTNRELRGGCFDSNPNEVRTGYRLSLPPESRNSLLGLRCARPL